MYETLTQGHSNTLDQFVYHFGDHTCYDNTKITYGTNFSKVCSPGWYCSAYTSCGGNGVKNCTTMADYYSCGITFTGNLHDYDQNCAVACTDSDTANIPSVNYYVKGTAVGSVSRQDCCVDSSHQCVSSNTSILMERSCTNAYEGSVTSLEYNCGTEGKICSDGACVVAGVCNPDWFCSAFGSCVGGHKNCTTMTDRNNCNQTFTGNISTYGVSCTITGDCYQEFANVSTCGGQGSGSSYVCSAGWKVSPSDCLASIDGNWATAGDSFSTANYQVNYSIPSNVTTAYWQFGKNGVVSNTSIPSACFINGTIKVKAYVGTGTGGLYGAEFFCLNSTGWNQLFKDNTYNHGIVEEGIWWQGLACVPDWQCSAFTACINYQKNCTAVTDLNSCGQSFNGTLSTYNTACGQTNATECFQEFANVSTCWSQGIGNYTSSLGWNPTEADWVKLFDGNYSSYSQGWGTGVAYALYNIPTNVTSAIWSVKSGNMSSVTNVSIPASCLNSSNNGTFFGKIDATYNVGTAFKCWNGTGYQTILNATGGGTATSNVYEEGIWWSRVIIDVCYQETATIATGCGGMATGNYVCGGDWQNCSKLYDGNWSTRSVFNTDPDNNSLWVNYTIPADKNSAIWQFKDDQHNETNLTIPQSCMQGSQLKLLVNQYSYIIYPNIYYTFDYSCYNSSNQWQKTNTNVTYSPAFGWYEEGVFWQDIGCSPSWYCSQYNPCTNNTKTCIDVTDINDCGQSFGGNLSTFTQNCTATQCNASTNVYEFPTLWYEDFPYNDKITNHGWVGYPFTIGDNMYDSCSILFYDVNVTNSPVYHILNNPVIGTFEIKWDMMLESSLLNSTYEPNGVLGEFRIIDTESGGIPIHIVWDFTGNISWYDENLTEHQIGNWQSMINSYKLIVNLTNKSYDFYYTNESSLFTMVKGCDHCPFTADVAQVNKFSWEADAVVPINAYSYGMWLDRINLSQVVPGYNYTNITNYCNFDGCVFFDHFLYTDNTSIHGWYMFDTIPEFSYAKYENNTLGYFFEHEFTPTTPIDFVTMQSRMMFKQRQQNSSYPDMIDWMLDVPVDIRFADGTIYDHNRGDALLGSYGFDTWHTYTLVVNYNANTYDFYIDTSRVARNIPIANIGTSVSKVSYWENTDSKVYIDFIKVATGNALISSLTTDISETGVPTDHLRNCWMANGSFDWSCCSTDEIATRTFWCPTRVTGLNFLGNITNFALTYFLYFIILIIIAVILIPFLIQARRG